MSRIETLLKNKNSWEILATPVVYITPKGYFFKLVPPSVITIGEYKIAGFHHQGVIVSRQVFETVGGFDDNLRYAADGKFLDIALARFESFSSNIIASGFRMGGRSMQNFLPTVAEANSYRPKHLFPSGKSLYLKNYVRIKLLEFESSMLVRWFLIRRHKILIKEIAVLDSEFIIKEGLG